MKERINEKIEEIEKFLEFLLKRIPPNLEEYKNNLDKKAICERYIEKIIEAIVDLAFLTTKHLKIETPAKTDELSIFEILFDNKIINEQLKIKLKEAKGMRNIIIHSYGKIDDEEIYNTLKEEIGTDIEEFIKSIKEKIE
jgi:uncharacterized protein YutE (UPF0331/DUF86 family)